MTSGSETSRDPFFSQLTPVTFAISIEVNSGPVWDRRVSFRTDFVLVPVSPFRRAFGAFRALVVSIGGEPGNRTDLEASSRSNPIQFTSFMGPQRPSESISR